nr:hypothetical protein [Tanacetum cinerariifolium]
MSLNPAFEHSLQSLVRSYKLVEIIDSSRLQDQMKFVFNEAVSMNLLSGRCIEAFGLHEGVGRDSVTLGVVEQLLARSHVGMHLKAGYAAEMEEAE